MRTTFGDPATRESTVADRREFLAGGLSPVDCRSCAVRVLVKKASPKHTSIQWTGPATDCPVFAERAAQGVPVALQDSCEKLSESIDAEFAAGGLAGPGD